MLSPMILQNGVKGALPNKYIKYQNANIEKL
jgi:hypothetical protein